MATPRIALAFLSLMPLCPLLPAQDQTPSNNPSPINTDRPAFTDASVVVPQQSLQIENGFLETTTLGHASYDFPESEVRFGLSDKTELRLTISDYYQSLPSGAGFASGFGDLAIGIKQQLGPIDGFDVSVVVALYARFSRRLGFEPASYARKR